MVNEDKNKIQDFYHACSDLMNAKLILADAKISKILKTVMASSQLIAIIGETLVNFNFDNEFSKAQVKNEMTTLYFQLPEEKEKIVALVFEILSECDTHQLDLHGFIKDFFTDDSGEMAQGFSNFVYSVVFPFRDALCDMTGFLTAKEEKEVEEEVMAEGEQVDKGVLEAFFDDITVILTQIKESINMDRKVKKDRRDELKITLDALFQSIDICNLKIINALMISLNYLLHPIKSVRFYKMELQERLMRFYSEM